MIHGESWMPQRNRMRRKGVDRPPITDSPWFWVELFSGMALLGILIIGPKFVQRQGQIERRFEGRQHAYSSPAGEGTAEPVLTSRETEGSNRVSLMPLAALVALVMGISAVMLLRSRAQFQRCYAAGQGGNT